MPDDEHALLLTTIARSRLSPWPDLAAVGQKPPQRIRLLVINVGSLFLAENTFFATLYKLAPSALLALRPSTSAPPLLCQNLTSLVGILVDW
jgi:hypothetical protein